MIVFIIVLKYDVSFLFTADVEKVFSYGGVSTSGRRNRLSGENLEMEIFLSRNKKILKDDLSLEYHKHEIEPLKHFKFFHLKIHASLFLFVNTKKVCIV
jgi:hypothetical protein